MSKLFDLVEDAFVTCFWLGVCAFAWVYSGVRAGLKVVWEWLV